MACCCFDLPCLWFVSEVQFRRSQVNTNLLVQAEKRDDFSFSELHAQYLSFATTLEGIQPLVESVLLSLLGQLCS